MASLRPTPLAHQVQKTRCSKLKRLAIAVLAIVLVLSVPGCWDRIELEDIAFVQAIGFDEGPPGYLTVTLEIGVTGSRDPSSRAEESGQSGQVTTSVIARTTLEAISLASLNLGRTLSLQHTALYLFGESLARADLRSVVQAIDRFHEVRSTAFVAVARGRAEDLLRVTVSPLEISPGRFIPTLMQQHTRTGLFEATRAGKFFSDMNLEAESPSCAIMAPIKHFAESQALGREQRESADTTQMPPTPYFGERLLQPELPPALTDTDTNVTDLFPGQIPRIGGGPIEILGTAVFHGGKMVGELTGEETRAMLMAKGDFEQGPFAVPDPLAPDNGAYFLGAQISFENRKIKVDRQPDNIRVNLDISLAMRYLSIKSQTDYTDPRNTPLAESAFEDFIKKRLDTTIHRAQTEMGSDVFGFGQAVKATFWTWPEWESYAWQSKFPSAEILTNVRVRLIHPGREFGPFNVPPSEFMSVR